MHAQTRLTARIAFASSVAAFALLGLSPSSVQAQPRMPTHVACVGDSITYGYGASSGSKSYPSVLQTMFNGVTVMNFGRNSATLLSVTTMDGPLQLSGNGTWGPGGVKFRGEARAASADEAALSNLLNIIGRREGAKSIISIG